MGGRRGPAAAVALIALLGLTGCARVDPSAAAPAPAVLAAPTPAAPPAVLAGPTPGAPPAVLDGPAAAGRAARPLSPDGQGRTAGEDVVRHVGALFHPGGDHFCSGSLITGGDADVVVTAAHCVSTGSTGSTGSTVGGGPVGSTVGGGPAGSTGGGGSTGSTGGGGPAGSTGSTGGSGADGSGVIEFAPAYRAGTAPYGLWPASRIVVDPRWTANSDPDLDVAFLRLAPRGTQRLADLLGTDRIAFGTAATGTVRVTGYPNGTVDPITCLGTASPQSAGQLRIPCTGYREGTSGSPWLTDWDPATRTGTVVGVIGGYQAGGDTDDISYSPYFGADVQRLYVQALATG